MVNNHKGHTEVPDENLVLPYEFPSPAFARLLETRLPLLLDGKPSRQILSVEIRAPDEDEVRLCRAANLTLRGQIQLKRAGSERTLAFDFPYPWHGVFVLHKDDAAEAGLYTWRPHLVHLPGFWAFRHYKAGAGPEIRPRLVLADGVHVSLDPSGGAHTHRKKEKRRRILRLLPGLLEGGINPADCWLWHSSDAPDPLMQWIERNKPAELPVHDEQDLKTQRLATFPVYLFIQLVRALLTETRLSDLNPADLTSTGLSADASSSLWDHLCGRQRGLQQAFLPSVQTWLRAGRILPFNPLNPVDALSQLTGFEKFGYRREVIEQLPATYRQNHPSYRGCVCPVESPESKRVGITLHLARCVRTDVLGRLYRVGTGDGEDELGYAASLVPFYQHNDGPRAMMGAKNLKQAVPLQGSEKPAVSTGSEKQVIERVSALTRCGLMQTHSEAAPGRDLLVAYMPFFGWNYEDAIVANGRLADEGVLDWVAEEAHTVFVRPGFRPVAYEPDTALGRLLAHFAYDEHHLRKPGNISPEDAVAYLGQDGQEGSAPIPISSRAEGDGELVEIDFLHPPAPFLGGRLTWHIRYRRPLVVGDKLMGRYGNKGVISLLLPAEQMPRLPDDPRLPESLRGRPVDLVLNPLGVISRMNLGQLIETQYGLASALGLDGPWREDGNGRSFLEPDLKTLRDKLKDSPLAQGDAPLLDEYGRMWLLVPDTTGNGGARQIDTPVVVGFQRICRLRHHPPLKAQARRGRTQTDRYSSVTGQPVAGRRLGGGQRLGEMEIWALAAHQARYNLAAALGYRSDPSQAPPASPGEEMAAAPKGQTWRAIVDHLLALGIQITAGNGGWHLGYLSDGELEDLGHPIETPALWHFVRQGGYRCPKCQAEVASHIEATGRRKGDQGIPSPTVADLLRAGGYRLEADAAPANPLSQGEHRRSLDLAPLEGGASRRRRLLIHLRIKKRQVTAEFQWGQKCFTAYRQIDKPFFGSAEEIAGLALTCPEHRSQRLESADGAALKPADGGLYDPARVGTCDLVSSQTLPIAHIRLAEPVLFNGHERSLIPVMPMRYRMAPPGSSDDLTESYALLAGGKASRKDIARALKHIGHVLKKRLTGKYGLLRRYGLGRRVDASARFVIVPDPVMDWDQCGVPTEALIVMLGPQIAQWADLERHLADPDLDQLIRLALEGEFPGEIQKPVREDLRKTFFWHSVNWRSLNARRAHLELARRVIQEYLRAHPQVRVLLNRQPSLHRYSVMAFRPMPLPPEDGLVLRIHPLVCKAFGADFDGDEMSLHFPGSDEEMQEAACMAPTRHLLSVADGRPVPGFDQDFVLGHYLISQDEDTRRRLISLLQFGKSCRDCADLLEEAGPWTAEHGRRLLAHLCAKHSADCGHWIPAWMRLCFERATYAGVSFGALELLPHADTLGKRLQEDFNWKADDINRRLDALVQQHLQTHALPDIAERSWARPGQGLAEIAISGARGSKQLRQLIAARGHLDPGAIGFSVDRPPSAEPAFLFRANLTSGMKPEEAFWAAMNARSSMVDKKLVTPRAGHLTRKLVLALWGWQILGGDCGSKASERGLLTCGWHGRQGLCRACYGDVPGVGAPPDGWPVGLIAAQSFGERGTQLSMQSFHTGERALSVDEVDDLLEGRTHEAGVANCYKDITNGLPWFLDRLLHTPAYSNLDRRHLELIWLVIHLGGLASLSGAWSAKRRAIDGLAGPGQWAWLEESISRSISDSGDSPFARLMMGLTPR